jgi:hypothetical protein
MIHRFFGHRRFRCEQGLGRSARLCPALAIIRNAGGVLAAVYAPAPWVIFDHMFG